MISDRRLPFDLIARGDESGWSLLYEQEWSRLVRIANAAGAGDRDAAQDVVQEAMLVLLRKTGQLPLIRNPAGWLSSVTFRLARAGHRTRTRHRPRCVPLPAGVDDPDDFVTESRYVAPDDTEAVAVAGDELGRTLRALATLPPHQAGAILALAVGCDMPAYDRRAGLTRCARNRHIDAGRRRLRPLVQRRAPA
jgi:DNA-directed RNA polymerase specialized sigma24 family protein